jgi:hypothetical protein
MALLTVLLAAIAGFVILQYVTHSTKSKIRRKMPDIRIKRIQVFPILRFRYKGKIIHFHHWFNFAILLAISTFVTSSFLDSSITRGFLMGGMLQGLLLENNRNILCNCYHCQQLKQGS